MDGVTVRIDMGDDVRTRRVAGVVRSAGGTVVTDANARVDYGIGPLACTAGAPAREFVTHHWVERCLYDERLVGADAHVALRPASVPLPRAGADRVCVAFSGIDRDTPEYHHAVAAAEAIGARTSEAFSRAATHLLCVGAARGGIKARKAAEWGIPMVGWEFLESGLRGAWPAESGAVPAGSTPGADPSETPGIAADPTAYEAPRTAEARRPLVRTLSDTRIDAPADAPRRRARPMRRHAICTGVPPDVPPPIDAPMPEPAEADDAPHVLYDDPAARREQMRLMALVDDLAAPKRRRRA